VEIKMNESSNKFTESILIADDNPNNLKLLKEILQQCHYKVRPATNGSQALESIKRVSPDLILLDIHMPTMDGYELCKKLKEDPILAEIPVIFISALSETYNIVKGFELGAVDFIVKPFEPQEVLQRVKTHLQLQKQLQEIKFFNQTMVDRELRIIELKREVNDLNVKLGESPVYPNVWDS